MRLGTQMTPPLFSSRFIVIEGVLEEEEEESGGGKAEVEEGAASSSVDSCFALGFLLRRLVVVMVT